MRRDDWQSFGQYNFGKSREPRFIAEIEFDNYSIALSSHAAPGNVPHLRLIEGVLENVSGFSQKVQPLEGRAQIGGMRMTALNTLDETRPLYDFAGSDYSNGSGGGSQYNDSVRTRITFKFQPNSLAANQAVCGINSILRYYIQATTGEVRAYRGNTSDFVDTGLIVIEDEVNRGAIEFWPDGAFTFELNGSSYSGTYTPGAGSGPLFIGGNSSRQIDGYVWDVRTSQGEALVERAFYPMDEGSGATFIDRIGGVDIDLVTSPIAGSWLSDFVGQQIDTYLRELLVPAGSPLDAGQDLRERRINVFMGFTEDFDDYVQIAATYINRLTYDEGVYTFNCVDVSRQLRKTIFDPKKTVLSANLSDGSESPLSSMSVVDTSEFQTIEHTQAFNDAPNATVGYLKIVDTGEIVRWTAKNDSPATFTLDARGLFGTTAQAVTVSGSDPDEWPEVEEFIYLEATTPQLGYALMCGYRLGDSSSPQSKWLPDHWHAGVPREYMATTEWENIGEDLYGSDIAGFILRFFHMKKIDAKKFIEQEIHRCAGTFSPVNSDGTIGLRRINEVLAGAAVDLAINNRSIADHSGLVHRQTDIVNQILVRWNWNGEGFTRSVLYQDVDSMSRNGASELVELKFKGLYPTRHSISKINAIVKRYMDRFRNPPQELSISGVPWLNIVEANDVINIDLSGEIEDYDGDAAGLNRPFEVEQVANDFLNGGVRLRLFASSGEAAPDVPIGENEVLADAFYTSKGTELSTVLSLDGSGNMLADGTLTGFEDVSTLEHDCTHSDSVFYYDGDFTIPPGVTLTIHHSVQIRVKGTFTNNGTIDGVGNGWPGYVMSEAIGANYTAHPSSIHNGFIGGMKATDGVNISNDEWDNEGRGAENHEGNEIQGLEVSFPVLNLNPGDQSASPVPTDIQGIPPVLTGTRGSHGAPLTSGVRAPWLVVQQGGDGGDSGAGLCVIARGAVLGSSSLIDLSGADGAIGDTEANWGDADGRDFVSGGGAGGGQGAFLLLIDGGDQLFPEVADNFTAETGGTTITGSSARGMQNGGLRYSSGSPEPWTGLNVGDFGGDPNFIIDNEDRSMISYRVQYIPEPQ